LLLDIKLDVCCDNGFHGCPWDEKCCEKASQNGKLASIEISPWKWMSLESWRCDECLD